jgi:hypothetical protein
MTEPRNGLIRRLSKAHRGRIQAILSYCMASMGVDISTMVKALGHWCARPGTAKLLTAKRILKERRSPLRINVVICLIIARLRVSGRMCSHTLNDVLVMKRSSYSSIRYNVNALLLRLTSAATSHDHSLLSRIKHGNAIGYDIKDAQQAIQNLRLACSCQLGKPTIMASQYPVRPVLSLKHYPAPSPIG